MPDFRHILSDEDPLDLIARLTINRPEPLNALNDLTIDELVQAVDEVSSDDSVRMLIVTGAAQAFCAGGISRPGKRAGSRGPERRKTPTASAGVSNGSGGSWS